MSEQTAERQLKQQLAELTGTRPEDWFLVNKARYGLEVILRVVAEQRSRGEVITQAFTCLTAVNPILSAGHIPLYADTSARTLSIALGNLQTSTETRALIVQHSFGIPADAIACREFADEHGLILIEDSAHKLGLIAKAHDKPLADVSVHSFGVEKMLPTKFGGAVWVNPDCSDDELRSALVAQLDALPPLNRTAARRAQAYSSTNRLLNHIPTWLGSRQLRTILTRTGLFEAPILPVELRGKNAGTPARPPVWVVRRALAALKHYSANLEHRTKVGELYYSALSAHATLTIPDDVQLSEALTRFPVVCASAQQADALFTKLAERGLHPGKWYRPTLFPGPADPALYNYDREACPVAEDLAARILNLPTNVSLERAKEIIHALDN